MGCSRLSVLALVLIGCAHGGAGGGGSVTLRDACEPGALWNGMTCVPVTAADAIEEARQALLNADIEAAEAAIERAGTAPLDYENNVRLAEKRGVAASYRVRDEATPERVARMQSAYDHLLALAPTHRITCDLAAKATYPFEEARLAAAKRGPPQLSLTWPRNLRLGEPVPLEIETVADPTGVLHRATIYLRRRGETAWRAADVTLAPPGKYTRIRLPGISGKDATALELYATASDRTGSETMMWSSAAWPREIPLRYDPPTPWYRTWWVWAIAGGVVATGAGVVTYALVWEPSSVLDADINRR